MNQRERAELDRHITGNYGEDQFEPPQCVMRIVAIAGLEGMPAQTKRPEVGLYVKAFDPEANYGRGHVIATANLQEALRFENKGAAMAFWKQVPKCRPLRPDGKPNRPMTAYTVEITDLDTP